MLAAATEYLSLMRPVNSAMVGFAVIVGVVVASPPSLLSLGAAQGFLTGFLVASYSMVINDYYDVEVDRVNNPRRPLPAGRLSLRAALTFALSLLAVGLVSAVVSWENFTVAAFFAWVAWSYSRWGKKRGLLGNMMVASSLAIPYIYGAAAVGASREPLVWFLAATSFLAGTGREIVKTVPDVEGDQLRGIRSVAKIFGPVAACRLGAAFYFAAVLSALLPILIMVVGTVYVLLVLIPDAIFLYASYRLLRDSSPQNAIYIKRLSLLGMFTGLIAFILGGYYRG